jgi:hypothetical protein
VVTTGGVTCAFAGLLSKGGGAIGDPLLLAGTATEPGAAFENWAGSGPKFGGSCCCFGDLSDAGGGMAEPAVGLAFFAGFGNDGGFRVGARGPSICPGVMSQLGRGIDLPPAEIGPLSDAPILPGPISPKLLPEPPEPELLGEPSFWP